MGEWTPLLVGFAYIGIVFLSLLVFPRSWWTQELLRPRRLKPSGHDGALTRRDHFREAGLAFLCAVLLLGGSALVYMLAARHPNLSLANHIASAYAFMCFLLAGVATLSGLIAAWHGIVYRPSRETSNPDAPAI